MNNIRQERVSPDQDNCIQRKDYTFRAAAMSRSVTI